MADIEQLSNHLDSMSSAGSYRPRKAASISKDMNISNLPDEKQSSKDGGPIARKVDIALSESSSRHEKVASHYSTDAEVISVKGMNFVRTGQPRSALKCFELAVKHNPNHSKAWYNMGMSLVSLDGSKEEALHCFEKAIEINPLDAEAWNNKGAILAVLGKDKEALTCYERALELKPSYAKAWQNKGILLLRLGHKKRSERCFKNAAELRL